LLMNGVRGMLIRSMGGYNEVADAHQPVAEAREEFLRSGLVAAGLTGLRPCPPPVSGVRFETESGIFTSWV
jgi:hypothetical protein